jgi:hypothetical protein
VCICAWMRVCIVKERQRQRQRKEERERERRRKKERERENEKERERESERENRNMSVCFLRLSRTFFNMYDDESGNIVFLVLKENIKITCNHMITFTKCKMVTKI